MYQLVDKKRGDTMSEESENKKVEKKFGRSLKDINKDIKRWEQEYTYDIMDLYALLNLMRCGNNNDHFKNIVSMLESKDQYGDPTIEESKAYINFLLEHYLNDENQKNQLELIRAIYGLLKGFEEQKNNVGDQYVEYYRRVQNSLFKSKKTLDNIDTIYKYFHREVDKIILHLLKCIIADIIKNKGKLNLWSEAPRILVLTEPATPREKPLTIIKNIEEGAESSKNNDNRSSSQNQQEDEAIKPTVDTEQNPEPPNLESGETQNTLHSDKKEVATSKESISPQFESADIKINIRLEETKKNINPEYRTETESATSNTDYFEKIEDVLTPFWEQKEKLILLKKACIVIAICSGILLIIVGILLGKEIGKKQRSAQLAKYSIQYSKIICLNHVQNICIGNEITENVEIWTF